MSYPQLFERKRWLSRPSEPLTLAEALSCAEDNIKLLGTPEARLEAEVLLAHLLGITRAKLYANLTQEFPPSSWDSLSQLVKRRATEPVAYITGAREFYGREFYVDRRVLVPRPETETLVEVAVAAGRRIQARKDKALRIADVGAGSGAMAITLALELPDARVYATDISPEALEVAAINCARHGVSGKVMLLRGDLARPLPERVDIMVANLPYVPLGELERAKGHWTTASLMAEPRLALDGGADGLDVIFRLIESALDRLTPGGVSVLEIGYDQADKVLRTAERRLPGARFAVHQDLAGLQRVVAISTMGPGDLDGQ